MVVEQIRLHNWYIGRDETNQQQKAKISIWEH